jgi:hypothetical protein
VLRADCQSQNHFDLPERTACSDRTFRDEDRTPQNGIEQFAPSLSGALAKALKEPPPNGCVAGGLAASRCSLLSVRHLQPRGSMPDFRITVTTQAPSQWEGRPMTGEAFLETIAPKMTSVIEFQTVPQTDVGPLIAYYLGSATRAVASACTTSSRRRRSVCRTRFMANGPVANAPKEPVVPRRISRTINQRPETSSSFGTSPSSQFAMHIRR